MERIRFFREFDAGNYVSENGNISFVCADGWLYIHIYIHVRGREFMVNKKTLTYKLNELNIGTVNELLKRIRYVYYSDDHRHVLSIDAYGTIIEFYHNSEMYQKLKM